MRAQLTTDTESIELDDPNMTASPEPPPEDLPTKRECDLTKKSTEFSENKEVCTGHCQGLSDFSTGSSSVS